ncbi:MAG: hypothetical protein WCP17_03205 [bacterium]
MKAFRIFLLVLIIIGIIALITQNIWVPKLVNKILLSEKIASISNVEQPDLTLVEGRQCYSYNHIGTKNEPYTVNEFININIVGKKVTGSKSGTQSGPDMTNGYNGTITGTLNNNIINDVFSYTIEGSPNKETEIYRTRVDQIGIEKLRYPLIDKGRMLVPDTTKEFKTLLYARVGCTASN